MWSSGHVALLGPPSRRLGAGGGCGRAAASRSGHRTFCARFFLPGALFFPCLHPHWALSGAVTKDGVGGNWASVWLWRGLVRGGPWPVWPQTQDPRRLTVDGEAVPGLRATPQLSPLG